MRAAAKRRGLVKGDEKLSAADLSKLSKGASPLMKRRIALAKTLKKMKRK